MSKLCERSVDQCNNHRYKIVYRRGGGHLRAASTASSGAIVDVWHRRGSRPRPSAVTAKVVWLQPIPQVRVVSVAHGLAIGEENTHLDRGWRCIGEACPLSADGMSPDGEEKCESVKHGDLEEAEETQRKREGVRSVRMTVCVCVCVCV